jgi:hypothetical protein
MATLTIPKAFLVDHMERDLPTPEILGENSRHFTISADDPAIAELRDDAEYYASPDGPDQAPGVKRAAKALLAALAAGIPIPAP